MKSRTYWIAIGLFVSNIAFADPNAAQKWLDRFRHIPLESTLDGVCKGTVGHFPVLTLTPLRSGTQLVRVSVPFAPGALPDGLGIAVQAGSQRMHADVRPLTFHPGKPKSVRRALLTFPYYFPSRAATAFTLELDNSPTDPSQAVLKDNTLQFAGMSIAIHPDSIVVAKSDGPSWTAKLIAPFRSDAAAPLLEPIELGAHFAWLRILTPDLLWPRIIDIRIDSLGCVSIEAQVQRLAEGDDYTPDLGWEISGLSFAPFPEHAFNTAVPFSLNVENGARRIDFPYAVQSRRGKVSADAANVRYLRCERSENVPMQSASWRTAAIAVVAADSAPLNTLRMPPIYVEFNTDTTKLLTGADRPDLALWPDLDDLEAHTRAALVASACVGDDFGNVTSFSEGQPYGQAYGMNRLNHCPNMFREAWLTNDSALRDTAVQWCINMHDLSIWWGDNPDYGGTRYNNATAAGIKDHEGDTAFMWRTNNASTFCTKGFSAFLPAYEETGDPRMATALRHQVEFAKQSIHVDTGECRNIGAAAEFMELYRATGVSTYRDEAMRLFRELATKLSKGDLFSQGGQPIVDNPPFIDDDAMGTKHPFAKPYIIGYALFGLPDLLREYPHEQKLMDATRAVAHFLAESRDPVGGWRYPHPDSSACLINQGMEHAVQIARAAEVLHDRDEPIEKLLDAIENVLQGRLTSFARTGTFLSGLTGWERTTGILKEGQTLNDLYQHPHDRDKSRDYTEGAVSSGGASPESLVYFGEVLAFYLKHRAAERLFHSNEKLAQVLARTPDNRVKLSPKEKGAFIRIERPDNSAVGFDLWAPEWVSYPKLGYAESELGGMPIAWLKDENTGTLSYTIERPEATFAATFTPHVKYVECSYTVWPKQSTDLPALISLGPCQQMKNGIFESDDADLMARMHFLANGSWISVASCANGNSRNVIYLKENDSQEMTGDMAASGWKTIQSARPDNALITCISTDGKWIAATAAEFCSSICNNANASHRCMHSQAQAPIYKDMPGTVRVNAYLHPGTLEDIRTQYERDVRRWARKSASSAVGVNQGQTYGLRTRRPAFNDSRVARMDFPLAWPVQDKTFSQWRTKARSAFLDSLGPKPPSAPFAPHTIAIEDRGTYEARKIVLNLSAETRAYAYLLVPKLPGRYPAIVALHDHGAHFSIGKEKVVRPFAESQARFDDAQEWTTKYYGGRWIGDELAKRGYVIFSTDALFWGDRGRAEGVGYEEQQALAANMLQLGLSWAGNIVWDDIRSAEFLQGLPEVDPERIACIGLSMGANRTWHLAAATDIIKAGAAICWLGDTPTLTREGNNQTTGQSAFSMIHPRLRNLLDYPDVAVIACPKPMLFFNGDQDGLFPVDGVQACFDKFHRAWTEQKADAKLATKIWPVPHLFNTEMQEQTFEWLDAQLK
jgi:dienelactone hydrolase